jgi:anaerobic ribonucleoside-triphosphate reductase activating protein
LSTQYTLNTRSLDIFIAGCNASPKCEQCFNPESWDFTKGELLSPKYFDKKIRRKMQEYDSMIENVMLLGGEPLDQDLTELCSLIDDLQEFNKPIWLFTHYHFHQVPLYALRGVSYVKTGRYMPQFKSDKNIQYGIKLSTNNQNIYKL